MLLTEVDVITPHSMREAIQIIDMRRDRIKVIAGGTDLTIQLKDGLYQPEALLNIEPLSEIRYITEEKGVVHIGALSPFADIIESSIIEELAPVLVEASQTIGGRQIQNRATIGGNICNSSPAADGVPPLYALGAAVVLRSAEGRREVPIELFFTGYRKKDMRANEIMEEVKFRGMNRNDRAAFVKLGLRQSNAISIASTAIWAELAQSKDRFNKARIALGAVAPTVVRAHKTEDLIVKTTLEDEKISEAMKIVSTECSPISDIRGSAEYRSAVMPNLVYKCIRRIMDAR
jgi:CO/xanthine dehydrogenase FAD-binding subunit